MTPTALLDSAVLLYPLGEDHPLRDPCIRVASACTSGRLYAHASIEMAQEVLFHRLRRTDRGQAAEQARRAANLCKLHPFDEAVMERMFALVATHPRIGGRDAVHAATALHHGIPAIISPDTAYDGIPGLRRIDPRDIEDYLARES